MERRTGTSSPLLLPDRPRPPLFLGIRMPPFLYRCPDTGFRVQGYSPEQTSDDANTFEPVTCIACNQVHWISPVTGKVLGEADE